MGFYLPLILFCISSTITPGPNNLMLLLSSINFGIKQSLPHYLGICIGFPVMVFIIGLGLESVFTTYPELHLIIKIIGAVYMLWLAYKIIISSAKKEKKPGSKPLTFIQAALFQWVNPKAWIMAIGAISTYTTVEGNLSLLFQVIIISIIYVVVSFICAGFWLFGGKPVKKVLNNEKHLKIFNLILGSLLVISIIIMIFE